jgi:hypothetical protein
LLSLDETLANEHAADDDVDADQDVREDEDIWDFNSSVSSSSTRAGAGERTRNK